MSRDELLRQAMASPAEDRAYFVTVLERSLTEVGEASTDKAVDDGDAVSGDALLAELDRRSAAYRRGASAARPAADVLADLKARQAREEST